MMKNIIDRQAVRVIALVFLLFTLSISVKAYVYYYAVLDGNTLTLKRYTYSLQRSSSCILLDTDDPIFVASSPESIVSYAFRDVVRTIVIDSSIGYADPVMNSNCGRWFRELVNLESISGLQYLNTSKVADMSYMFYNCKNLTNMDVSKLNTSNVKSMHSMFYDCKSLTSIDVSGFNTSSVTDMSYMFSDCNSLKSIKFRGSSDGDYYFDTSNVEKMNNMFYRCSSLEDLDVSGFKTSNVKDMSGMFDGCSKLVSLDLNNFDTQNVTDMCRMFRGCLKLSTLDVSKFNTSKVTDMSSVFSECESLLEIDVTNWNTSNVTNMSGMFYWTGIRSLDLTHFDVSKVETMKEMFYSNIYLQTIYCNDTWNCQVSEHMFAYCSVLKGAAKWGEGKSNDVSYANPGNGYFTYKDYDVWVCGVQVTRNNYNDLSSISSVYGSVKYDPYSNTLILEDATINGNDNIKGGIYSQGKVLNINAVGVNNVSSDNSSAITCSDGSVNITGTGSLSVIGATGVSVLSDSKENSISVSGGVLFSAIGMNAYGIIGKVNNGKYLTTLNISGENTKVRIKGAVQDVLRIKDLVLSDGLMITQPTDAYFSNNSIKNSDGTFVKDEWVEIGLKKYGFEVGGIPVTILNKDNITGSNIKQGTATYDDETKTLTLTDCSIGMDYTTGTIGIKSSMDSLAIHLVGNNSIGMVDTGIESTGDVTIAGPGKLGFVICNTGIYMAGISAKDLAITDGAKLDMTLVGTGILGQTLKVTGTTRVVYRKNLRVSGGMSDVSIVASTSAISDMNKLVLSDGLSLTAPVGAKFENHAVCDKDGNVVKGKNVRFSLAGDVNNDGAVTMADANAVVNYFLATDKPSSFDVDNANVNGDADDDGKPSITMADANAIVNMFLGQ